MARRQTLKLRLCLGAVVGFTLAGGKVCAQDPTETRDQLRELQKQNAALQEQLRQQQALIESLSKKVNDIQEAGTLHSHELESLEHQMQEAAPPPQKTGGFSLAKVSLSGEGAVGFFHTGSEGLYPNSEFRVDEAKLFVEAPIWGQVYFFGELKLMTHEALDLSVQLGELYLDFENISELWHQQDVLNLRAGRFYIPFGEEYQHRNAIDNPLITSSLTDIWGVDEGFELYGRVGKFSYAAAVQNGGPSGIRDFDSDKSISGRLSYDPNRWLHLSVSGMRTGDLQEPNDYWSELYFANGWFMPFSSTNATKFHANLVEGDIELRLPHTYLKAFGGYAHFDDNATDVSNNREIYYYSFEAVQDVTRKFYAAARFSQIFANQGYPLAGNGNMDDYFFSGTLTDNLWRLSLGLGYKFSDNLILKAEYSFERGHTTTGATRDAEDLFALQAAFRF